MGYGRWDSHNTGDNMKVYEITVSTTVQIDSLDDYAESKEHAIDIMWDRWGVYKDTLEITEVKTWEEDDEWLDRRN